MKKSISPTSSVISFSPESIMLVLIALSLGITLLFPELRFFLNHAYQGLRLPPSTLFIPVMLSGTIVCVILRRHHLSFGYVDVVLLAVIVYLTARNITASPGAGFLKHAAYGLALFYLSSLLTWSKPHLKALLCMLVIFVTVLATYAIVEFIVQKNILYPYSLAEPAGEVHRVGSTLIHPVPFASWLVQSLPFCILFRFLIPSARAKWTANIIIALATVALFFTFSLMSWLIFLLLGVISLLVIGWKKARIGVAVVAAVAAATSVAALVVMLFNRQFYIDTFYRAHWSYGYRISAWSSALKSVKEHFLFGVGFRNGPWEIVKNVDPKWLQVFQMPLPVDNQYLSLFLEEGIIGLALWLTFLSCLVIEGLTAPKHALKEKLFMWAALASIVAFFLNSASFEALTIWPNYFLFWIAAGLLHGISTKKRLTSSFNPKLKET
jgi:O-antigen ligase